MGELACQEALVRSSVRPTSTKSAENVLKDVALEFDRRSRICADG